MYCENHFIFQLFCALQFVILTVEESRLDRKRAGNDSHQLVTSVNDCWLKGPFTANSHAHQLKNEGSFGEVFTKEKLQRTNIQV